MRATQNNAGAPSKGNRVDPVVLDASMLIETEKATMIGLTLYKTAC